jgi:diguanylate cyclase (GGDEF)-like protein/putative nucleotidyltransferase with HDIG domain
VTIKSKAFWLAVVLSGFLACCRGFAGWQPDSVDSLVRLGLFGLAAAATAGLKVHIPGISSTLSMSYVFVLTALLDLGLGGALIVGAASVVAQTFCRYRTRPKLVQLLFNLAATFLSVLVADHCIRHFGLRAADPLQLFTIVAASLAYFLVNTLTISGIIGLSEGRSVAGVWRDSYLWTSPQYMLGGLIAIGLHYLTNRIQLVGMLAIFPILYLVYCSYRVYLRRIEEQQKRIGDMAALHLRTIEALALAIDAKDDSSFAHLRRVQMYAAEVGREMHLPEVEMQAILAAALLHDIGKLAVPDSIVSKPGLLTPDEFEKMKIHPIVGAEILERVNFPYPVVPIVRSHHERYDGTGYPDGLKGEEIPIGARILSAVDSLDALSSDRQYRKAMPLEEAIRIIGRESGKSFDPQVVRILQARYHELEAKVRSEVLEPARASNPVKVERNEASYNAIPSAAIAPAPGNNFRMSISNTRRELQTLVEIANDLGSSLSLDETLALLAVRLGKAIPHDAVVIWIRQQGELVPRLVKGESFRLLSSLRIPLGQGLSGWVAENNRSIVNGNPAAEAGYLNDPGKVTRLRSAIGVPLLSRDRVVGVLTLYQLRPEAFNPDHRRILETISAKVGVVIDNALRFEQVQDAARTDELTGLLNARSLFEYLADEVAMCTQHGRTLAVIVGDLNGFKKANDRHGHLAGNRILQNVAAGLRRCCRASDTVARLGGDEFVVVLTDPGEYLPRMMERIAEVGELAASEINYATSISISAGYALFPQDATDAEGLLEKADERMYENKRRSKMPKSGAFASTQVIKFPRPVPEGSGMAATAQQA